MALEEKIKQRIVEYSYLSGGDNINMVVQDIFSICQKAVDEACKKQREICAKQLVMSRNIAGNIFYAITKDEILNSPSPEVK